MEHFWLRPEEMCAKPIWGFRRLIKLKMFTLTWTITSLFIAWPEAAFAREGLRAVIRDAPAAVRAAWPATFAYLGPNRWGTTFVIGRRPVGAEIELYFLTANHVVDAGCAVGVLCRDTVLVRNMRAQMERQKYVRIAPIDAPSFPNVFLVERIPANDLAVVATRVTPELARDVPALPIAHACGMAPGEPLYSVGFSATMDRVNTHGLITDAFVATKRWAEGIFVGEFLKPTKDATAMVGTTVDGITGHSGAALINARGEVISVFNQTALKPGHAYDGDETPGHWDWHSLGAACEVVARLRIYEGY